MPVSRACRCCRRRSSSSCSATTSRRVAGMLDTGWTHSDRSSVHSLHTQTSPAPTQSSTLSGDNPVLPLVCQFLMQCHHLETRGRHAWTHSDRSSVHSLHTQTPPGPTQPSILSGENPMLPLVCQFLMQCHHLETRDRHAWTHSDRSSVHSLHTQTSPAPTPPGWSVCVCLLLTVQNVTVRCCPWCVSSDHPGQLSLLSSAGRKMSKIAVL